MCTAMCRVHRCIQICVQHPCRHTMRHTDALTRTGTDVQPCVLPLHSLAQYTGMQHKSQRACFTRVPHHHAAPHSMHTIAYHTYTPIHPSVCKTSTHPITHTHSFSPHRDASSSCSPTRCHTSAYHTHLSIHACVAAYTSIHRPAHHHTWTPHHQTAPRAGVLCAPSSHRAPASPLPAQAWHEWWHHPKSLCAVGANGCQVGTIKPYCTCTKHCHTSYKTLSYIMLHIGIPYINTCF